MVRRLLSIAANPSIDKLAELNRIESGAIHRLSPLVVVPGGKGLNVARAAATLGAATTVLALLAGHAGRWIADSLASTGVEARFVWTDGETRSCLSIFEREHGVLTEFYETAGVITQDDWRSFRALVASEPVEDIAIATMSGSLPGGAPLDGFADLCALVQSKDIPVLLDTHGSALKAALSAHPWLVKLNLDEAAEVTGTAGANESDSMFLARAVIELGAQNALITLGRSGATLVTPEGAWSVSRPPIIGRYPVGSGDSLLAGVATRLLVDNNLVEATQYGAAAAAANAQQPGAGVLDPNQVRDLQSGIEIKPLV